MVFADAELARRIELNGALGSLETAQTLKQLGLKSDTRFIEVAGGYAVYTGPDLPINRATAVGLQGSVLLEELDRIEKFYAEVGLPVQLDVTPYTDPVLIKLLGDRGYQITSFFNQHFRPLSQADAQLEPVEGVQVIQVEKNSAAGQTWAGIVAGAFGGKDEAEQNPVNLILPTATLNGKNNSCFLALVDGEAAGGGALTVRYGLASLFSTATLPKFRGKGVQKALIQARLAAAQSTGCELVVVMTVPGNNSQRNLERRGFRIAYTKIIQSLNMKAETKNSYLQLDDSFLIKKVTASNQ